MVSSMSEVSDPDYWVSLWYEESLEGVEWEAARLLRLREETEIRQRTINEFREDWGPSSSYEGQRAEPKATPRQMACGVNARAADEIANDLMRAGQGYSSSSNPMANVGPAGGEREDLDGGALTFFMNSVETMRWFGCEPVPRNLGDFQHYRFLLLNRGLGPEAIVAAHIRDLDRALEGGRPTPVHTAQLQQMRQYLEDWMTEFRSRSARRWGQAALKVRTWIIEGRTLAYFTNRDRMDYDRGDDGSQFDEADMDSEGDDHPDVGVWMEEPWD